MRAIRDQVIVTKDQESEQKSPGGIVIVRNEEKNITGTVVAVGPGRMTTAGAMVPLDVKAGDRVLFNKSLAVEVKDGDQTFMVLREDNIVYVF